MFDDIPMAQAGVLGSMILDPRCAGEVMTQLRPNDFGSGLARDTFTAVREMFLDGEKIDPVTVLAKMNSPDPNCRSWVLWLMDSTPTAANVHEYAAIVREESRLRDIQSVGVELISKGLTLDRARDLVGKLDELLMDRRSVEDLSMEECLLNFYNELEHTPEYLSWGLAPLDDGLMAESSDYVIIGGYPSDGKTALSLHMAYSQAKTKRVGYFSLETKSSKLFNRIFSSVAQVSGSRIKRRALTDDDFSKLAAKSEEVRHNNLHLIKASSMTVEDITTYARARRFEIIYIDYLTLIPAPGRDETAQATYISKALHRLAQDNNITVVALSQLSRSDDKSKNTKPTLQRLRSSGQLEQDADIVMFIYRTDQDDTQSPRILSVAKNKEGPTGRWKLAFDGDTQTFTVDDSEEGKDVARKFSALGRKAKGERRNNSDPCQTTFVELTSGEKYEVPF